MIVVEQFRVKLNTVNTSADLLHGLNLTGVVGSGLFESVGQLLYLVAVGVPDSYLWRESLEDSLASVLNWEVSRAPALRLRTLHRVRDVP